MSSFSWGLLLECPYPHPRSRWEMECIGPTANGWMTQGKRGISCLKVVPILQMIDASELTMRSSPVARLREHILAQPLPLPPLPAAFLLSPESLPSRSHRHPNSSQVLILGIQPMTDYQCNQSGHYLHRDQQLFISLIAESLKVLVKLEIFAFKGCCLLNATLCEFSYLIYQKRWNSCFEDQIRWHM